MSDPTCVAVPHRWDDGTTWWRGYVTDSGRRFRQFAAVMEYSDGLPWKRMNPHYFRSKAAAADWVLEQLEMQRKRTRGRNTTKLYL